MSTIRWNDETIDRLLACETNQDLLREFPGSTLDNLKRQQRKFRTVRLVPDAESDVAEVVNLSDKRARSSGTAPTATGSTNNVTDLASKAAEKRSKGVAVSRIAELLEKSGIPTEEIGRLEKVRVGTYQMLTKNNDGEAEIHDLDVTSLVLSPKWETGPQWPVVQPAAPTVVRHQRAIKPNTGSWKKAVILPDPQIGYRRDMRTGLLDPFHDERAMDVALQITRAVNPDLVVNLGDLLDLPMFGRYTQEAAFASTAQAGIDRAHLFLAEVRAAAPNAAQVLLEGNHDRRLENFVLQNARAAFGLQRANQPESWPVMSVPNLLRLDELGVEYVGGYPAGRYWINDRLNCQHGLIVRSGGSTAKAIAEDERVSTIHGHIHRIEMHYKTVATRDGGRTNMALSPGCLCRIDGAVPSVKGSTDPFGRPLQRYENWQQGLAVVMYQEGDSPFSVTPIYIHEGFALFNGVAYAARQAAPAEAISLKLAS